MQDQRIQYSGRYLYADNGTLERALKAARSRLASEGLVPADITFRCFVENGTSLTVNLGVPMSHEHRFVAANIALVLAHGASQGSLRKLEPRAQLYRDLLGQRCSLGPA